MARQKHYIELYNEKDRQAYLFLNNVYHCRQSQLQVFISQNRIKSWEKEKLLERVKTAQGDYLKPGKNFYKYLEREFTQQNRHYHSQSPEHDCSLAQKYIELHTQGKDFTWRNEEDLKQDRQRQIDELNHNREYDRAEMLRTASVTDCVIETQEETIAYEITTNNYSSAVIESKTQYAQARGIKLEMHKI